MNVYLIRWRGRCEGPLHLKQIDSRLNSGSLGLLTEIQVDGHWITLRDFYKAQALAQPAAPAEFQVSDHNTAAVPQPDYRTLPPESNQRSPSGSARTKPLTLAVAAALVVCLVGGIALASHLLSIAKIQKNISISASTNEETIATSSILTTNSSTTVPLTNNSYPVVSGSPTTNSLGTNNPMITVALITPSQTSDPPSLPPLPENKARTFRLKNGTNYTGTIISVDRTGLVIKLVSNQYTSRLAWNLFDEEQLTREPKVIALRKAQQAAKEAAEQKRIAAAAAVEKVKRDKADAARNLEEYRARQNLLIETSIRLHKWQAVTGGHLKAWGSEVSIGEIFSVVAPSARWSAEKLSDKEPERYTYYLVEANWINENFEPVAMQYLVTADGSDFHLHGCFVSGRKMPDLPFILGVKKIWDARK